MSTLIDVHLFQVTNQVVFETQLFLQEAGKSGLEGFVLWLGTIDESKCNIVQTLIPKQKGVQSPFGVYVTVENYELHKINLFLFENKLRLIAQVHSHPVEAYHSTTDDQFPIATELGSLSIVVPYFASQPFSLMECAIYRLYSEGWIAVSDKDTEKLIEIED